MQKAFIYDTGERVTIDTGVIPYRRVIREKSSDEGRLQIIIPYRRAIREKSDSVASLHIRYGRNGENRYGSDPVSYSDTRIVGRSGRRSGS